MYLLIAVLIIVYFVCKEKFDNRKMPQNAYFDWKEYYKDIRNGMDCRTQLKKQERLEYYKSRNNLKEEDAPKTKPMTEIERFQYICENGKIPEQEEILYKLNH